MGYITTFSIYHDGMHLIKENAQDFANKLFDAAQGLIPNKDLSLSSFANLVRVQKCKHSSDVAIYVHKGNCVTEIESANFDLKRSFHRSLLGELAREISLIIDKATPEELYECLLEDVGVIPKNKLPNELHNAIVAERIKGVENDSINRYLSIF